jgi:hypothetical protein
MDDVGSSYKKYFPPNCSESAGPGIFEKGSIEKPMTLKRCEKELAKGFGKTRHFLYS